MESCVQSQGEEEEIELISLQPPQPQRPFSSLRLLLRSTPAFLLLVIILLLILNSQEKIKIKITVTTSLVRVLHYQFRIYSSRRGKWGERGLVFGACTHKHTDNSISSSKNIAPFFTDTAIRDWRSRSADAQLSLQQSAIVWR
jgi:hypothetical protein